VHRESLNMVTPAMQLASKIPDLNVQLWASAILKVNIPPACIIISIVALDPDTDPNRSALIWAVLDPDPYWDCGSASRSMEIDQN
jgi:hypothetical protein